MTKTFTFNDYTVASVETAECVEFYLGKRGSRKKIFMFGLRKEDCIDTVELESVLVANIPQHAGYLENPIRDLRARSKMTQQSFSDYLEIPRRTIQDWERGVAMPAPYLVNLIEYKLIQEKKI